MLPQYLLGRIGTRVNIFVLAGVLTGIVGCSDGVTNSSVSDQTIQWVTLNTTAITLDTTTGYNTVQLLATAHRGDGSTIPDVVPTFIASDEALHVTDDGLVTGVKGTIKSAVFARMTYQGVTRIDTAWITVTQRTTIPTVPLTVFSVSIDSTMAAGVSGPLVVTALDEEGNNLSFDIPFAFKVSDPVSATVDRNGWVTTQLPERTVTFTATTTVYGKTYTDSVQLNIGYPKAVVILAVPRRTVTGEIILEFVPDVVYLAAGGNIVFCNGITNEIPNKQPLDVVFSMPEAALPGEGSFIPTGPGNIPPFMWTAEKPLETYQLRVFNRPGTYEYHSELYGSRGRFIVR